MPCLELTAHALHCPERASARPSPQGLSFAESGPAGAGEVLHIMWYMPYLMQAPPSPAPVDLSSPGGEGPSGAVCSYFRRLS